jgi:hypothetical protein
MTGARSMPNADAAAVVRLDRPLAFADAAVIHRTPISAEARGLARDFCRRVGQEATRLNEQPIGEPLRHRVARYPDRRPRESMLRDLERRWRDAQPQQFRLQFHCTWQGKNVFMTERAVTVLTAFRLQHWDANDYGVEVVDTWLDVSRRKVDAGMRSRMWIGSHALARWYQRSGARSDARLLHDIAIGAAVDPSDREAFPHLDDVHVPVGVAASWRGAIMMAPETDDDELVLYVKTFI